MQILITGGAGFIGTAMAKRLVEDGNDITILDLAEKTRKAVKVINAEYILADISNYDEVRKLESYKFDYIYHFASQTSGLISQENPTLDVDTNVKGMLNICRLASVIGGVKIIFTSSMAVYGDHVEPINEDSAMLPRSNYGVSKIAAETYLKLFEQRGVKNTIFRLFNVYGPGQDLQNMKQGMLSIFVSQIIQNKKIDITGSLERYRDFVYIDDVVNALILGQSPDTNGEIYNVGSGVKTTVRQLVSSIIKESGLKDVPVNNVGAIIGDQFGTVCDADKIKKLGWSSKTSVSEGLKIQYQEAERILS